MWNRVYSFTTSRTFYDSAEAACFTFCSIFAVSIFIYLSIHSFNLYIHPSHIPDFGHLDMLVPNVVSPAQHHVGKIGSYLNKIK